MIKKLYNGNDCIIVYIDSKVYILRENFYVKYILKINYIRKIMDQKPSIIAKKSLKKL